MSVSAEATIETAELVLRRIADNVSALDGTQPGGALLGPRLMIAVASRLPDADRLVRAGVAVELLRRAILIHRAPQSEEGWRARDVTCLSGTLRGDMLFAESFRLLSEDGEPRLGTVLSRAMAAVSESEAVSGSGGDPAFRIRRAAEYYRGAAATGAILGEVDATDADALAEWGHAVGEAHERALLGESVISPPGPAVVSCELCEWVLSAVGARDRVP
ncbi:MAG TPA: hypothetical protein VGM51_18595 [Armatimonadota bacterium]